MKIFFVIILATCCFGCTTKKQIQQENKYFDTLEIIDHFGYNNPDHTTNKILCTLDNRYLINDLFITLKESKPIVSDMVLSGYLPSVKFIDHKNNRIVEIIIPFHNCEIYVSEHVNGVSSTVLYARNEAFIKEYLKIIGWNIPKVYQARDSRAIRYGAKNLKDFLINGVNK